MASLLANARAEIEEAKLRFRASTWSHLGTLVAGLATLFATSQWTYAFSVVAVITEVIAWWLHYEGTTLQTRGEEARRRALLMDALGVTEEVLDVTDLHLRFSRRARGSAEKFEDANYYASTQPPGLARLRDHLQESAFWSRYLYETAAARSRLLASLPVAFVIAGVSVLPFLPLGAGPLLARALAVFLPVLFVIDELGRSLAWGAAATQFERVDRRLEHLRPDSLEAILAVFADCTVAATTAPPIPSSVYNSEKDRLNELWHRRIEERREATQ